MCGIVGINGMVVVAGGAIVVIPWIVGIVVQTMFKK
jgi:hypothetical protein